MGADSIIDLSNIEQNIDVESSTLTGKRSRKQDLLEIIEDSSPTKKLKSSDESEYQVNNLKTKKQDLEEKLKQITRDLQHITSTMEQKKKSPAPVKRTASPVPTTKSRRGSAKTPQTVTAGRPVRERKKSTILREAEGTVVELSPRDRKSVV